MRKKAFVMAIISMLLGAGCLELYLRAFEARVSGGTKATLLVTTEDLVAGDELTRSRLGTRELPEAYLEARQVRASDIDRVLGTKLAFDHRAGDVLLWSDVAGMTARRRSLSSLVGEGMRAFTLRPQDGSFAGLLEPGDRVDVVAPRGALEQRPLVENAVVLAVGQRTDTRAHRATEDQDDARDDEREVTLRVTPDQGRTLAAAVEHQSLRLLLRDPDDVLTARDERAGAAP
jgi:Flp pilus assembly protein CpaB